MRNRHSAIGKRLRRSGFVALAKAARQSRCGFTLPELLMSLLIVAALMLVGVGAYWRMTRGFALRAGVGSVEAAVRGARAFAVHERTSVVIMLDPVPEEPYALIEKLQALGKETVGCWHFEARQIEGSKLAGALGQEADIEGVASTVPGKIGRALVFDGTTTAVTIQSPYFDEIRDGVFLEAYVWPDPTGMSSGAILPIVSKSDGGQSPFTLALRYQPTASQDLFELQGSVRTGSATLSARTDALIRAGEWTHVALAYMNDALGIVLRINGQEVELFDVTAGTGKLQRNTAALAIGRDDSARFKGRLDEVKVGSLVTGESHVLPKNTEVRVDPGSSDGHIHLDEEGKLDTRYHGSLVEFRVRSPKDRLNRVIQVNWLGEVTVSERGRTIE